MISFVDTILTPFFLLLKREVDSPSSTRSLAASRRRAARTVEPVGEHVYKTLFLYSVRSSRNPVRRLPFETDMVRNM